MDRILTKLFYIVVQVLKVLLIKICKIQLLDLLLLLYLSAFAVEVHSALELHSALFEKKYFSHEFFFFIGFTQDTLPLPLPSPAHTHPLNSQNALSMTIFFVNAP